MAKSLNWMQAHRKAGYRPQLHRRDQRAAKDQNLQKRRN